MGSVVPTHFLCFFFWILDSEFPYRIHVLRARQEIRCTFCCWPPGPLARRERRAYPLRYVRSEQHSQRACGPQPGGARRRAGICGVAAPRRCHHIACVAAPCICPPGARAKMHTLFPDGPLLSESQFFASSCLRGGLGAAFTAKTRRHKESSRLTRPMQTVIVCASRERLVIRWPIERRYEVFPTRNAAHPLEAQG